MIFSKVTVVGLGYIGLPTAAIFASSNIPVLGLDVNHRIVDIVNSGNIHIIEPGLEDVVKQCVKNGYLRASTEPEPSDAFIIAVPTPFKGENHEPDLSYIKSASQKIAKVLKAGDLVILESTSPVGATEQMAAWLAEARLDLTFPSTHGTLSDIKIAHCPERVLPGHVMRELIENDRVIGGMTHRCSEAAASLYKIFVKGECILTNAKTAEMSKLTENSFRDVNIAFANELSVLCDELDINVWELISLANRHPRVNILQPGPGVGGHCIAVDPWFIVSRSPDKAKIIKTARLVNDAKPFWVVEKVKLSLATYLLKNKSATSEDVTIICYGLAFKPNIDDLRESPAMHIVEMLKNEHFGRVLFVEPNVAEVPDALGSEGLIPLEEALSIDAIHVLLVDHKEFKERRPNSEYIVDTKGIWN